MNFIVKYKQQKFTARIIRAYVKLVSCGNMLQLSTRSRFIFWVADPKYILIHHVRVSPGDAMLQSIQTYLCFMQQSSGSLDFEDSSVDIACLPCFHH